MSYTNTNSQSTSYTEARANYVMGKAYENLIGLKKRGLITMERANTIRSQILYLMDKQVLDFFELQFIDSNGSEIGGLHYKVISGGYIVSDDESEDENYWRLSDDTHVGLLVSLNRKSSNIEEADRQLEEWGAKEGQALKGASEELKTFSKGGFAIKQIKKGDW